MDWYKFVFLITALAIPFMIVSSGRTLANRVQTTIRLITAVLVGWFMLVMFSMLIIHIDLYYATTPGEIEQIVNGDGAHYLGGIIYGWIYMLAWVAFSWFYIRTWITFRKQGPD